MYRQNVDLTNFFRVASLMNQGCSSQIFVTTCIWVKYIWYLNQPTDGQTGVGAEVLSHFKRQQVACYSYWHLAGCGLVGADIPGLVEGQWTLFVSAISPPRGKNERLRQIAVNCRARKTEERTSLVFEYMVSTPCTTTNNKQAAVEKMANIHSWIRWKNIKSRFCASLSVHGANQASVQVEVFW